MTGGFLSEAPKDERGEGLMSDTGTFLVWPPASPRLRVPARAICQNNTMRCEF